MSNNSKKLLNQYGFRKGSYKYVLPGGELMRYIGQQVLLVEFKKEPSSEDETKSEWKTTISTATINSISQCDIMQLTWLCKYTKTGDTEEKEVRILPEGFSFEGKDPEESGTMLRFVPMSMHYSFMEEDSFHNRLAELWKTKSCLSTVELLTLTRSKDSESTLKYLHNVGALIELNEGEYDPASESRYIWIRALKISFYHKNGDIFNLRFSNNDRSWSFLINAKDPNFDFEGIGRFKIIDLASTEKPTEEVAPVETNE